MKIRNDCYLAFPYGNSTSTLLDLLVQYGRVSQTNEECGDFFQVVESETSTIGIAGLRQSGDTLFVLRVKSAWTAY